MPQTVLSTMTGTAPNTGLTTVSGVNQHVRFVDKLVESLDPMDFSLTRTIGFGKPFNNPVLAWTDERFAPTEDVLGAAIATTPASGTQNETITVTNWQYFQQWDVLRVGNERMLVTARPAAAALTVTRGHAGSATATAAAGAPVKIVGTAVPENVDAPASPITRGDEAFNRTQLFEYGIQISHRENYTETYLHRSPEFDYEVAKKFKEGSRDLELTLIHGLRQEGVAGAVPSAMGGIPSYLTQNVTNVANAALTKQILQSNWQAMYRRVGKENMGKDCWMNVLMKRVVAGFYQGRRQGETNGTTMSDVVEKVVTDFGVMKLRTHFFMPEDEIWTLDPANLSIRPYKGYGKWHDTKLPASGSYEKGSLSGDFTLQAKGDRAHGRLHAISTNESGYTF